MPDFVFQVLIRLAIIVPALLIVASALWYGLKAAGVVRPREDFDLRDLRTWPLRFALVEAALFAVTYVIVIVLMGGSGWGPAVAGGTSAVVAVLLGPPLVARLARQ
jgi:hypothetical protein